MVERGLSEKAYTLVDELVRVAKALDTTPARVALAWVQNRPGVVSPIIGARTVQQLDDNLGGLDLKLGAEHTQKLNALSEPQLDFPAPFLSRAGSFMHGGITVNGDTAPLSPFGPKPESPGPKY
jgi:diketogulonate reductase-like aldo/keto reductase